MRSSFPVLLCVFLAVGCGKPAEPQTPTPPEVSTDSVSVTASEEIWLEGQISLELTDIYTELVSNPAIQYKYTLGTRGDYVFRVGELSLHHTFDIDPHQFFIPAWKAVKATELPIIEEEIDDGLIRFGANGFDNFRFPDFHMPEGTTFRHARASHWLEEGMNIVQISLLLGHEHLETTMIYLDITIEQKADALATLEDETDKITVPKWNPDKDSLASLCGLRKLRK